MNLGETPKANPLYIRSISHAFPAFTQMACEAYL